MRPDGKTRGFIAQSVGEVLPSAVFRSSRLQVIPGVIDKMEDPEGLHLLDLGPVAIEMIGAVQVLVAAHFIRTFQFLSLLLRMGEVLTLVIKCRRSLGCSMMPKHWLQVQPNPGRV